MAVTRHIVVAEDIQFSVVPGLNCVAIHALDVKHLVTLPWQITGKGGAIGLLVRFLTV